MQKYDPCHIIRYTSVSLEVLPFFHQQYIEFESTIACLHTHMFVTGKGKIPGTNTFPNIYETIYTNDVASLHKCKNFPVIHICCSKIVYSKMQPEKGPFTVFTNLLGIAYKNHAFCLFF